MKTDPQIQQDVIAALKADALLAGSDIEVAVKDGVVTLTGIVSSELITTMAQAAAINIADVKRVEQSIQIETASELRDEQDLSAFRRSSPIDF